MPSAPPKTDLYEFESGLWQEGFRHIMGLDEVGRGCLAGPVVAAGVILDPSTAHLITGIADSKLLKADKREFVAEQIRKHAISCTVAVCGPEEIDRINILKASLLAMAQCAERSNPPPDFLLIDGNKGIDSLLIRSQTIVKGDGRSASIGAASIVAKVHRDRLMAGLHEEYPQFGWDRNVGYPTAHHYKALQEFGYTRYHRRSFRLRTEKAIVTSKY
ncbi:ribonuclease HII [Balneolales bacterium ANBcel1]|nr:ribonuclease HII [Balneolales bacterium ANBcel1]